MTDKAFYEENPPLVLGHPDLKAAPINDDEIKLTWSDDPLDFVIWERKTVRDMIDILEAALDGSKV